MRQLRVTQARGALASLGVRRSVPQQQVGRSSLAGTHHSAPESQEQQVGRNAITRLQKRLYYTHLQHRVPRSGRATRHGI